MGQGVSGGTLPDFPYSVGQEVCRQQPHGLWSLVDGEERSTKKPVSIFVLHADGVLATNFLKRFKTLRHPNLLPFLHGAVLEDQKKAYVVTERVEPLLTKLASSEYHNDPKYQHILAWGLHCVATAVSFLNKQCQLVHGNLTPHSIFVTSSGDWKLCGYELLSHLDELRTLQSCPLIDHLLNRNNINNVVSVNVTPASISTSSSSTANRIPQVFGTYSTDVLQWPPELQQYIQNPTGNGAMSAAADWSTGALDGWLFGCLLYSIWNWRQLKLQDPKVIYSNRQSSSSISGFEKSQLKNLTQFPATLKEEYPKMLSASGRARWSCERFLESNYFRDSAFVQACLFLEHLTIKDSFEKDKFFRALPKLLDEEMPLQYARTKVLPHLMTALDVGAGANASVLAPIIKIAQGMTSDSSSSSSSSSYALDTTRSKLQASFLKWFQSPDRVLRIALLQQLPAIIGYLDNDSVSRDVFPSVAQGFLDTSPQLRELTVKSMLVFAPRLSEKLRNNELLKYLARLQVDAEAGIRTNTTIAIGKLAPYLTPAVRDKVLIPAFTRALHDTFPPARRAAIIALQATHRPQPSSSSSSSEPQLDRSCYSVPDIAGKLIPAVSPLTLDEDQTVRRSAMDCLLAFVDTLSTAQTALDKAQQANTTTATHSVAASTSSAHASSSVVNSGGDGGDASNGSTVLGWASKWWSGPGQPPSPNTPTSASSTSMSSPSSPTSFAGRATPPISHEAPSQYSSTSQTSTATPTATYSSSSRTGSTSSKGGGMKLAAKSTTNHNAGWGSGDGWGDGDDHEDDEVGSVWGADTASTKPAYAGDDNDDSGWGDSDFSVTPTTVSRLEQKNPHRSNSGW